MSWLQAKTHCRREQVESIEDALLSAGAVSVTFEDKEDTPILEPAVGETPLWANTQVTGLFNADTDTSLATVIIVAELGELPDYFRWEILEDKDWERSWMDNYKPMQFGERLWICPSWKTPPNSHQNTVNLMLDPGLAFGTGTHPTTALCLQWLESVDLKGKTIIDYGCGSGILGIAAVLLGAKQFIGVDNDPQALIASKDNAERNALNHEQYQLYLPEQLPPNTQGDLLIANILAGPLIELCEEFSNLLTKDSPFAISGILSSQESTVSSQYNHYFTVKQAATLDDWALIQGLKR